MEFHDLAIQSDSRRGVATVKLGGLEIQDGLNGLSLTMTGGSAPTLQLEPLLVTGDVHIDIDGPVRVVALPAVHAALVAVGWTPPGGVAAKLREAAEAIDEMSAAIAANGTEAEFGEPYRTGYQRATHYLRGLADRCPSPEPADQQVGAT